jgi:predicted RNA-binding Zn-ribbon protein involved in translation (DUF1610 family)
MKIITRGVVPEEKVYRVTCVICYSVIEFNESEGEIIGQTHRVIKFKCPLCNYKIITQL